jgi:hypothetical protein
MWYVISSDWNLLQKLTISPLRESCPTYSLCSGKNFRSKYFKNGDISLEVQNEIIEMNILVLC